MHSGSGGRTQEIVKDLMIGLVQIVRKGSLEDDISLKITMQVFIFKADEGKIYRQSPYI